MIAEYREKALRNFKVVGMWWAILFLMFAGLKFAVQKSFIPPDILLFFLVISYVILIIISLACGLEGCFFYAKAKGYRGIVGLLLGLFLIIGWLILFFLTDISEGRKTVFQQVPSKPSIQQIRAGPIQGKQDNDNENKKTTGNKKCTCGRDMERKNSNYTGEEYWVCKGYPDDCKCKQKIESEHPQGKQDNENTNKGNEEFPSKYSDGISDGLSARIRVKNPKRSPPGGWSRWADSEGTTNTGPYDQ